MKNSFTKNRKGEKKDRVQLICEAQPCLHPNDVRLLLVGIYYQLTREGDIPAGIINGYLSAVTDKIIGLSDKEAKELAKRFERRDFSF